MLTDLAIAQALDAQDVLAHFRDHFVINDPNLVYLDGNSLGRLPKATETLLQKVVTEGWGTDLIRGWNSGWIEAPSRIGGKLAQLVGAQAHEVVVGDSTSVNLFKLLLAALLAQPKRRKIVTDDLNFPSDVYILQGLQRLVPDCEVVIVPSPDGIHGPVEALAEAIDEATAVVTLSHTLFKSGYTYDMAEITALAHRKGALILWDLSHSVGAVPVTLNAAHADLAVGCTYKYVNGGPGAPAFLYVRQDLQKSLQNPISGWMGQKDAFAFGLSYEATSGVRRFLTGTPPMLSLLAIEPGLDLLLEAGMSRLRAKSVQQSEYLIGLWEAVLAPLGFRLNSPQETARRGSHVSLGHEEGLRIDLALIEEMNVLPDFRAPDSIRLGIAPLYNSFADIWTAVHRLEAVVSQKIYTKYNASGIVVT